MLEGATLAQREGGEYRFRIPCHGERVSFFSRLFGGSDGPPEPVRDPDDAILQSLLDAELDLTVERPVDYFLYFPSEAEARAAAADPRARGLTSELHPPPDPDGDWLVMLRESLVVSLPTIKARRAELEAIAAAHGGEFEGWDAADAG